MAYTQADADRLRQAIASGATRLRMNNEEVQYRSLAEMKSTLADIEASLEGRSRSAITVGYPRTTRGL